MNNDDLPLLSWKPPKETLVFPATHWTGKARQTAEVFLRQKSQKAKQTYWNRIIDQIVTRLIESGVPKAKAQAQVDKFRHAVQHEIDLITVQQQKQR